MSGKTIQLSGIGVHYNDLVDSINSISCWGCAEYLQAGAMLLGVGLHQLFVDDLYI